MPLLKASHGDKVSWRGLFWSHELSLLILGACEVGVSIIYPYDVGKLAAEGAVPQSGSESLSWAVGLVGSRFSFVCWICWRIAYTHCNFTHVSVCLTQVLGMGGGGEYILRTKATPVVCVSGGHLAGGRVWLKVGKGWLGA